MHYHHSLARQGPTAAALPKIKWIRRWKWTRLWRHEHQICVERADVLQGLLVSDMSDQQARDSIRSSKWRPDGYVLLELRSEQQQSKDTSRSCDGMDRGTRDSSFSSSHSESGSSRTCSSSSSKCGTQQLQQPAPQQQKRRVDQQKQLQEAESNFWAGHHRTATVEHTCCAGVHGASDCHGCVASMPDACLCHTL